MQTDPPRTFDVSSWDLEQHGRDALELAQALCKEDEAVDSRRFFHAIVRASVQAPKGAFAFVAEILKSESSSQPSIEPSASDISSLQLAGPLARSLSRLEPKFSGGRIWGRDLVTVALLAADDPSYAALLDGSDCTLAEFQDQWFDFLKADSRHRKAEEWQTWWKDAGVPLPSQRSGASRTYLMTWNPGRQKDTPNHPPKEALQDITQSGSAVLPWRISNARNVFVGERVFLHRQGNEPRGLVGAGRIAGPVEAIATTDSKAPRHRVPVRWNRLYTEPIVALKALKEKSDKISEWKAQKSGNALSAENAQVAEALWKLAVEARDRGIAGFLSDRVSGAGTDLLDVEREAHAVARVAASLDLKPPLSIGVFGDWGSGKTFFMELIQEHIAKLAKVAESSANASTAFHKNIVQIRFNAWHYIETNLWASLVNQIFTSLDSWLREKASTQGGEAIEDVFGRLETPRRLLLESVTELIEARKQEQVAKQDLESANATLIAARTKQDAAGSLSVFDALRAVLESDENLRAKIAAAAKDLGILDLQASGRQLSELIEQARADGNQLHLISGSIARRLGQPLWLVAAILLILLVPLGIGILGNLSAGAPEPWGTLLAGCRSGIAQASAALAAAGVWLGRATSVARKALNRLQECDRTLETQLEKKLTELREEAVAKAADVNVKTANADRARTVFDAANAAVRRAEGQYEVNPRERLSRFIRGKVADGEYAKELSLVSTVRKDFELLADMMVATELSEARRTELEEDKRRWKTQREALNLEELEQQGLLRADEREQLELDPWRNAEADLPHFDRVVLYVDDLDRCPPEKVVDVLQAIHLLLYFPLFVVVVAVDSRWVSRALIDRYPGLLGHHHEGEGQASPPKEHGRDTASPRDYLEKVFQVPYWVRPVEEAASRTMVKSLVGGWPQEDTSPPPSTSTPGGAGAVAGDKPGEPVGGEEKIVEVGWIDPNPTSLELTVEEKKFLSQMAPHVNPSPRTLRRFINVYRVLRSGLRDNDLRQVTRESGDPTLHRALIAQLAMVSGAPHLCEHYFVALRGLEPQESPVKQLAADLEGEWELQVPSRESQAISGALRALGSQNDTWAMIEALRAHVDTVKRYSFGGE